MRPELSELLCHPGLRPAIAARSHGSGIATGNPHLDALLHWRGWPPANLIELLTPPGVGELTLVAPALARLATVGGWIFLVDPPHLPHAQALAQQGLPGDQLRVVYCPNGGDQLWAGEQILRSGICAALLLWERDGTWRHARLLRLQGLARSIDGSVFLYRPPRALHQPSPSPLRIALTGTAGATQLTIHKQLGNHGQRLSLDPAAHNTCTPLRSLPALLAAHHSFAGQTPWHAPLGQSDNRVRVAR